MKPSTLNAWPFPNKILNTWKNLMKKALNNRLPHMSTVHQWLIHAKKKKDYHLTKINFPLSWDSINRVTLCHRQQFINCMFKQKGTWTYGWIAANKFAFDTISKIEHKLIIYQPFGWCVNGNKINNKNGMRMRTVVSQNQWNAIPTALMNLWTYILCG